VDIDGVGEAPQNEKYIFVEDKHAMGDLDLLENEGGKTETKSTTYVFIALFIIISAAAVMCCYLNYTLSTTLAKDVFFMFLGALLIEMLILRMLVILVMALLKYCKGMVNGYEKIEYKSSEDIRNMLNEAIKDMLDSKKKKRQ